VRFFNKAQNRLHSSYIEAQQLVSQISITVLAKLLRRFSKTEIMKTLNLPVLIMLAMIMFTASSCDVVGGIFKAGMWTAVIIIVLIVVLVLWLMKKMRR
jgi:ABC-type polysaccharide/polyol phosphate export permease